MQIFLDTANLAEIQEAVSLGVISGITTNPSLVAKEGKDFFQLVREIAELVQGPISAEVIGTKTPEMLEEARKLAGLHQNVVVKIPMTAAGLQAVRVLNQEKIRTNVTLVYSVNQALLAAHAGATYVSPFVGRLDDLGYDGMSLVEDVLKVYQGYGISTQIIAASIRHPLHVVQAAKIGAHIATIPHKILLQMIDHPLTKIGIDRFLADWEKASQGK